MQPEIVRVNGQDYRVFQDDNGVKYAASSIDTFALRRIFNLEPRNSKIIDFADLTGFWSIHSVYISSPETSDVTVEILDSENAVFFKDKLYRNQLPKSFPTVLIYPGLKMKLLASRTNIDVMLIYLKPAHLAYSKDF